jgi:uncharacterized protein with von Willebrand factor type A (vWA) domain
VAPPDGEEIVFVVRSFQCPKALEALIVGDGYAIGHVGSLDEAVAVLRSRRVRAVLVGTRPFTEKDREAARLCRQAAPHTAIVAVANAAAPLWRLKMALDCHATALLLWPTEHDFVAAALASAEARGR